MIFILQNFMYSMSDHKFEPKCHIFFTVLNKFEHQTTCSHPVQNK